MARQAFWDTVYSLTPHVHHELAPGPPDGLDWGVPEGEGAAAAPQVDVHDGQHLGVAPQRLPRRLVTTLRVHEPVGVPARLQFGDRD